MNRLSLPTGAAVWPLASLLIANLLPLAGVYLWGWSLTDLLTLYWLENAVVGLFTVLSMIAVRPDGSQFWPLLGAKLFSVPFFLVHYGMFWLGHGLFLRLFFGGSSGGFALTPLQAPFTGTGLLVWPLALLLVSHGVAFLTDFLARGEYRTATVNELMMRPYGRVAVLHVTIVIGAFVAAAVGPSLGVLLVFVLVKIVADVSAYLNSRESGQRETQTYLEVAG